MQTIDFVDSNPMKYTTQNLHSQASISSTTNKKKHGNVPLNAHKKVDIASDNYRTNRASISKGKTGDAAATGKKLASARVSATSGGTVAHGGSVG